MVKTYSCTQCKVEGTFRKERHVVFNDALNTFYLRLFPHYWTQSHAVCIHSNYTSTSQQLTFYSSVLFIKLFSKVCYKSIDWRKNYFSSVLNT